MKKIVLGLFMLMSFYSNAQCNIVFNDLVKTLRFNETSTNYLLSNKGYVYDSKESTYFCGENYLYRKYYKDGVIGIDYMMPNSSYDIQKIINDAKYYGMKLSDSKTNPSTGMPIIIYVGGNGNLMMQISSNEKFNHITIYGLQSEN